MSTRESQGYSLNLGRRKSVGLNLGRKHSNDVICQYVANTATTTFRYAHENFPRKNAGIRKNTNISLNFDRKKSDKTV